MCVMNPVASMIRSQAHAIHHPFLASVPHFKLSSDSRQIPKEGVGMSFKGVVV